VLYVLDTYMCVSTDGSLFRYLSQNQKTALHIAIDNGHYGTMLLLLARGAHLSSLDRVKVVYSTSDDV